MCCNSYFLYPDTCACQSSFETQASIFALPGRSHTGDVCIAKSLTQYYSIIQIRIKECKGTLFKASLIIYFELN